MTATDETHGEPLFAAALHAPLVAVDPAARTVLHAATMDAVVNGWERGEVSAACGTVGLKLMDNGERASVPWPPRVSSLPEGTTRCLACHTATGRKRPRSAFVFRVVDRTDTA